jgi:hypothetical protein
MEWIWWEFCLEFSFVILRKFVPKDLKKDKIKEKMERRRTLQQSFEQREENRYQIWKIQYCQLHTTFVQFWHLKGIEHKNFNSFTATPQNKHNPQLLTFNKKKTILYIIKTTRSNKKLLWKTWWRDLFKQKSPSQ